MSTLMRIVIGAALLQVSCVTVAQSRLFGDMPMPSPAEPSAEAQASIWSEPPNVARIFQEACVMTGGDEVAAVDWGLTQGFTPADFFRGNVDGLLAGQAGSVLAAPGTNGRVLLVAATGRQCTVWAEQVSGPSVRSAVIYALDSSAAKKGRLELQADRNFEHAGAWRNQMQWRYRAAGASVDLGVGVVTTLVDGPGTQALHAAPMPATPAYAPDGLPTR